MQIKLKPLSLLLVMFFIYGCNKDVEEVTPAEETKSKMSGMMVHNAWIRLAAQGTNSAMFGMVMNHTDVSDTLIGLNSEFAVVTEVHETYKRENDMMGMRRLDFIAVDKNDSFELKPRAKHVMLIRLKEDLKMGDVKEVTLTFKNAGDIIVKAEVKDMPGGAMDH